MEEALSIRGTGKCAEGSEASEAMEEALGIRETGECAEASEAMEEALGIRETGEGAKELSRVEALYNAYGLDITEITGFDDLHRASGILKDAMERAAGLYGSQRTWFLVGGSTCGVLAALGAAVRHGDEILVAANCHISVFHAAQVMELKVRLAMPEYLGKYGIYGSIRPKTVKEALSEHPGIRAVVVTSPTYEGILSDISGIAAVCHRYDIPLITDEAHGAHLKFMRPEDKEGRAVCFSVEEGDGAYGRQPESGKLQSAVEAGADLTVQSLHKTLPALTQTALLHLGRTTLIDAGRIGEQLSIYETSSPS